MHPYLRHLEISEGGAGAKMEDRPEILGGGGMTGGIPAPDGAASLRFSGLRGGEGEG